MQSHTHAYTHTHTYILTDQFPKSTFLDSGTSKHINLVKTRHRKFWPKTILPLPNGSRVVEVKNHNFSFFFFMYELLLMEEKKFFCCFLRWDWNSWFIVTARTIFISAFSYSESFVLFPESSSDQKIQEKTKDSGMSYENTKVFKLDDCLSRRIMKMYYY